MDLPQLLPLLRSPRDGSPLRLEASELVSQAGERFPVVNGKPVLVREVRPMHTTPPEETKVSQNQPRYVPPLPGIVLHLGSGNVLCEEPRVVSLDILPCSNVDIVAEAEALPFADAVFDHVDSSAVFEHLVDPLAAIKEVKRVVKPGGTFRIDTAFLQGYHGFPSHYFNMTPQAVEALLVGDCELLESYVPDSATPINTVVSMLERFLEYAPTAERERLLALPLREAIASLRADMTRGNPVLAIFGEYALRSLAASFVVMARRKPTGHDREYYAARMEVMLRHHEVCYYRRLAIERGHDLGLPEPPLRLDGDLAGEERALRELRDRLIGAYLAPTP